MTTVHYAINPNSKEKPMSETKTYKNSQEAGAELDRRIKQHIFDNPADLANYRELMNHYLNEDPKLKAAYTGAKVKEAATTTPSRPYSLSKKAYQQAVDCKDAGEELADMVKDYMADHPDVK